jgi:hypothetical protein
MRAVLVVSAVALGMTVVGCSGGAASPKVASLGSTTTTVASTPPPAGLSGPAAYSSCMRSHGVPGFPDPVAGPNGDFSIRITPANGINPNSSAFASAQQHCQSLLPDGGKGLGPRQFTFTVQQRQDYLTAAACMRSHGVAGFPDPVFSPGDVSFPIPPGIDATSKQFVQARQICQKLIPQGLPYSG